MNKMVIGDFSWERLIGAVEKVRKRLQRAATTLAEAGIPYAVIGGNAVAAWVARLDEAAVRNTADVNVLIKRSELGKTVSVLAAAGFVYRHVADIDLFLDGRMGRPAKPFMSFMRARKCGLITFCPLPM